MIVDHINNVPALCFLPANIQKAFSVIADPATSQLSEGRHDIDGDSLFVLVQRYTTQPMEDGIYESHRKYLDLQYLVKGSELICHQFADELKIKETYNPEGDYQLYSRPESYNSIAMQQGMFALFFPNDGHLPGRNLGAETNVEKLVVKVAI